MSRMSWARKCLVAVAVTTVALALPASVALASGSLSSIVLSTTLPGFVLSPAGANNGPLNDANVDIVFPGDTTTQRQALEQLLDSGQLSGYVRLWRSQPLTGDAILLLGFQSSSIYNVSTFLGGFERGAASLEVQDHGSSFTVPGVVDAKGYNINLTNSATRAQEYIVAFAKGNSAFFISMATTKYDLSQADAITLAQRQWALAPGSPVAPETPPSVAVDLLFGIIAALVVAGIGILWQRQRTRRLVRDNPTIDVTRYATYKHLSKSDRKIVRKSMVKQRLNADVHFNEAAVAWADHNLVVYWITVASFVALDVTVLIVSQGHVVVVSFLAIAMAIGALNLRRKRRRFIELQDTYAQLATEPAATLSASTPTID
jgi:hypothetical protein